MALDERPGNQGFYKSLSSNLRKTSEPDSTAIQLIIVKILTQFNLIVTLEAKSEDHQRW